MTKDEPSNELNEITELLIRLRPARADLDSRVVFYEAGYNACLSKQTPRRQPKLTTLIAASLVSCVVTAAASFHFGKVRAEATVAAVEEADRGAATETRDTPTRSPTIDASPKSTPAVLPTEDAPQQPAAAQPDVIQRDSFTIARWADPLQNYARSARLDREGNATLTAFHSSVVARRPDSRNWADFPFPDSLNSYRESFTPSSDMTVLPQSPLAVGDLHHVTHNLEAVR